MTPDTSMQYTHIYTSTLVHLISHTKMRFYLRLCSITCMQLKEADKDATEQLKVHLAAVLRKLEPHELMQKRNPVATLSRILQVLGEEVRPCD